MGISAIYCFSALIIYLANTEYMMLDDMPSALALCFVVAGSVVMAVFTCFHLLPFWYPIVHIGRISYSLYLIHENIGIIVISATKKVSGSDLLSIAAAVIVSVSLATLMFYLVEKPIQEWLRRVYVFLSIKLQKYSA
jgi:peptidoglycan/LPS O-acetylase OafA/YrhL